MPGLGGSSWLLYASLGRPKAKPTIPKAVIKGNQGRERDKDDRVMELVMFSVLRFLLSHQNYFSTYCRNGGSREIWHPRE